MVNKSNLIISSVQTEIDNLAGTKPNQLKRIWEDTIENPIASVVTQLAAIIGYADINGIDISWVPMRLRVGLRRVIYGMVNIDTYSKFANTTVEMFLPMLSKEKQDALLLDSTISFVEKTNNGFIEVRKNIKEMSKKELNQILTPNGIRNTEEQKEYLLNSHEMEHKPLYQIIKHRLHVRSGAVLTKMEIRKIIKIMKSKLAVDDIKQEKKCECT